MFVICACRFPAAFPLLFQPRRPKTSASLRLSCRIAMGKRKVSATASPDSVNENKPALTDESEAEQAKQAPAKKRRRQKAPEPPVLPTYDGSMRPSRFEGPAMRVLSWNVASLRSLLAKTPAAMKQLVEAEDADVVCLQETKLQDKAVDQMQVLMGLTDWHHAWNCSTAKKGYSGTAIISNCDANGLSATPPLPVTSPLPFQPGTLVLQHAQEDHSKLPFHLRSPENVCMLIVLGTKSKPMSIHYGMGRDEHDQEGRLITAEYPHLYVVNAYVPNAGEGLKRLDYRLQQWDIHFAEYLQQLAAKKPVVLTGDLNCCHQEIDIHAPKRNLKSPGFTQEERDSFSKLLIGGGFTDAWRHQYPEVTGYTYWNFRMNSRANNKGWRLDYFLVSEPLVAQVHDCFHLKDTLGSDHCPVGLVLKTQAEV